MLAQNDSSKAAQKAQTILKDQVWQPEVSLLYVG